MRKAAVRSSSTKILASVVLVAGAASVAGMGTFGAFTSTTSASENVSTETVKIDLTDHAALGTDVAVPQLVPGDTAQRAVILTRAGGTDSFGSVKLTTTGTGSKLTTEATHGLQLAVDQCTGGTWKKDTGGKTLSCDGGAATSVIAARPVVGANLDLAAVKTALNAAGAKSELRLTLSLPATADNSFQGLSDTVTFTFDVTQRAAQAK